MAWLAMAVAPRREPVLLAPKQMSMSLLAMSLSKNGKERTAMPNLDDNDLDRRRVGNREPRRMTAVAGWCPWPESNQHSLRNSILSRARLPVPPQGQSRLTGEISRAPAKRADYSESRRAVNPRHNVIMPDLDTFPAGGYDACHGLGKVWAMPQRRRP